MRNRTPFLLALCCVMIALASSGGCQKLTDRLFFTSTGHPVFLTDPKYDILEKGKKKVVVLCRSDTGEPVHAEEIAPKITKSVSANLRKNVKNKKLEILDVTQSRQWLDQRGTSSVNLREIGTAFEANFVVLIELQKFNIQNSPNTMQAQAAWNVKSFDVKKNQFYGEDAMKLTLPQNLSLPVRDETSVPKFQRQVIGYVSAQISALYHPHDARKVYDLMDAHVLEYH